MQKDVKSSLFLLFLATSFIYLSVLIVQHKSNDLQLPMVFGQIINRLVLAEEMPKALVFVGDVMLARDVERKLQADPGLYPFISTEQLFKENYVVGNFEASIPKIHQPTPDFNMRFSVKPSNLDPLVEAKFTHWSLANNHSLDYGESGFEETIRQLELRNFTVFGSPQVISSSTLTSLVVNQQKIAILGINTTTAALATDKLYVLIKNAQKDNDLVVIYIHWGEEYELDHNQKQQKLARSMIEAGADLIVGHHPHVVQDIELYQDRLIIYSLGNFLFDQYFSPEVQTGLTIVLKPEAKKLSISLNPVSSQETRVVPVLLTDREREVWLEQLAEKSTLELKEMIKMGEIELHL